MCTTPWAFGIGLLFAWVGTLSLGGVGASWGLFLVFCQKIWYSGTGKKGGASSERRQPMGITETIALLMLVLAAVSLGFQIKK